MRKIHAEDAKRDLKKREYDLPPLCRVRLEVPAGTICNLTVQSIDGTKTRIGSISTQCNVVEHYELEGFEKLFLESPKPFLAVVSIKSLQLEEPHDNLPIPERPPADNVLQRLRANVRQQMGVQREAFLENNTGMRGYEIPDDEPLEFEEELMAKIDKAQSDLEEHIQNASQNVGSNDPIGDTGDPSDSGKPVSEPSNGNPAGA